MTDLTQLLSRIESGDPSASEKLLPLVYEELRLLAAHKMAREASDHTLQATALVHEAYLRLVDGQVHQNWSSRGHFFSAAAEAMRRLLVENARRKKTRQRFAGESLSQIEVDVPGGGAPRFDVLAVDEALTALARVHPEKAELVKLRFFSGLTLEEAAAVLGISTATCDRHWKYARAWLARQLRG